MILSCALLHGCGNDGEGRGESPPSIAWTPQDNGGGYEFGTVAPGQTASDTFTLTNSGGSSTGALSVALAGAAAYALTSDTCTGTALDPGESCAATVQFAPTTLAAN